MCRKFFPIYYTSSSEVVTSFEGSDGKKIWWSFCKMLNQHCLFFFCIDTAIHNFFCKIGSDQGGFSLNSYVTCFAASDGESLCFIYEDWYYFFSFLAWCSILVSHNFLSKWIFLHTTLIFFPMRFTSL